MNLSLGHFRRLVFAVEFITAVLALHLHAQMPGDERWDGRFAVAGIPSAEGTACAMAFAGTNIYLGGSFQAAGRMRVHSLVRLAGQQMEALPDAPQAASATLNILALEMFQGRLYVGGFFTNLAHLSAGGLGCWDGANWSVPGGSTGLVYALHADADGLLAGGNFSLPGWTNPVALARWNGSSWTVLNSELFPDPDAPVRLNALDEFTVAGENIYASLSYSWVDDPPGIPKHLLARCDRSNHWSNMTAPNGETNELGAFSMATFRGQLVVGGDFTNAANPALRNIALYDGQEWQPLGGGLAHAAEGLAANDHFLYASYRANDFESQPRYAVARWDGTNWVQLGTNLFAADFIQRIFLGPDDTVYAIGSISTVGNQTVAGLARWNGQRWEPLFSGTFNGLSGYTGTAYGFAEHQGQIYLGGIFKAAGDLVSEGVARWDGSRWNEVGSGGQGEMPSQVRTLVSSGPRLFAGGGFTNMGGAAAANTAAWDGTRWTALGTGMNNTVWSLAWWQNSLYAGGDFTEADGLAASKIAHWNGSTWEPLGTGCNSNVVALAGWKDKLYAGGRFTRAGDLTVSLIACWDGATWQDVGGGLNGANRPAVRRLAGNEDGLYVIGNFTSAGGQGITNIARWDGTHWHEVGDPLPCDPYALAVRGRTVFVAGRTTNEWGKPCGMVYRWDGTNWASMGGSGVSRPSGNVTLSAILATENEVFVGGLFTCAGNKPSVGVARWIEQPRLRLEMQPQQSSSLRLQATSDPGLRFALEASSDLSNWEQIGTGQAGQALWNLDSTNLVPRRFYRAVATP